MDLVDLCLPRDNRAFAAYAKSLGVEYNLGATTDSFNDAHNKFLLDYVICKNHKVFLSILIMFLTKKELIS